MITSLLGIIVSGEETREIQNGQIIGQIQAKL